MYLSCIPWIKKIFLFYVPVSWYFRRSDNFRPRWQYGLSPCFQLNQNNCPVQIFNLEHYESWRSSSKSTQFNNTERYNLHSVYLSVEISDPILPFRTEWQPDVIFVCRSNSYLKRKTKKLSVNTGCYFKVFECFIFYIAYYMGVPRHWV